MRYLLFSKAEIQSCKKPFVTLHTQKKKEKKSGSTDARKVNQFSRAENSEKNRLTFPFAHSNLSSKCPVQKGQPFPLTSCLFLSVSLPFSRMKKNMGVAFKRNTHFTPQRYVTAHLKTLFSLSLSRSNAFACAYLMLFPAEKSRMQNIWPQVRVIRFYLILPLYFS